MQVFGLNKALDQLAKAISVCVLVGSVLMMDNGHVLRQ